MPRLYSIKSSFEPQPMRSYKPDCTETGVQVDLTLKVLEESASTQNIEINVIQPQANKRGRKYIDFYLYQK